MAVPWQRVSAHRSGEWIGSAASLDAALELIDDQIMLVRQRLVARA